MHARALVVLLLAAMTVLPMGIARAQDGEPADLAALSAAGATVEVLASAPVALSTDGGASPALRLSRVIPATGDQLPLVIAAAPELWYIEAGSVTLTSESGQRQQASAGEQLVLTESGQFTVEIAGDDCPSALRLELTNVIAMRIGSEEEGPRLGPNGRVCPAGGVLTDAGDPLAARPDPATATIARVTWNELAFAGGVRFSGPVAYAVESGTLTVTGLPGADASLAPGSWLSLATGQAHSTTGKDGQPVTALVAGAFVGSGSPLPTPAPTEQAGVTGSSYLSPSYGYRLAWDETWQVVAESSTTGTDTLQLNNGVSDVYLQSFAFDGDARACVDGLVTNAASQPGFSDVAYRRTADGDPITGGDAERRFAVIQFTYTSESGAAGYTEYVECRTIPGWAAVVIFTQIVRSDRYAEQVDAARALLNTLELA